VDERGTEGFFDAILFLLIITVAFCLVLTSYLALVRTEEVATRDSAVLYARRSLASLLMSSIPDAFYVDPDGGRVPLENGTNIEQFLLEETYLVHHGMPVSAFSDCNLAVEETARSLVTGAYDFAVRAEVRTDGGLEDVLSFGVARSAAGYSAASDYIIYDETVRIELVLWWS